MAPQPLTPEGPGAELGAVLDAATRGLEPLVVESRRVQEEMLAFRQRYERRSTARPLTPRTLHEIREGTRRYLDLQQDLAGVAVQAEEFATPHPADPATLAVEADLQRKGVATALAASTTLYDNYLAMLPLLGDRLFRRLVNEPDLGYGIGRNDLWHLAERLNEKHGRRRLQRLAARWEDGPRTIPGGADPALEMLTETIESSPTFHYVRDATLDRHLPTTALMRRVRVLDGLAQLGDEALYTVSEAFGNAIGSIETRKGKLWQREDVLGHLHRVLRPLDLLLEKTPFRLTDAFIPGHFGHVAIWMGKPKQIRRLGVWKDRLMQTDRLQACRPLIEEGRSVLEALRSGVELNALRVFANVDDLAILRPTHLKRKEKRESLVRGFHQVGKDYDFNFDVETTGTIVCSELPYHVYPGVEWTTEEQLGRFTISPDDVALEALEGGAVFDLVALYHDGTLVPPQDALGTLRELVT